MCQSLYINLGYVAAGNNSLFALSITPADLWIHRFAGLFLCFYMANVATMNRQYAYESAIKDVIMNALIGGKGLTHEYRYF